MNSPSRSSDGRVALGAAILFAAACLLVACERQGGTGPGLTRSPPGLLERLSDPSVSHETRIERILGEGRPGNVGAVPVLIRVMKDRSQAAFLLEPDTEHPLGYRAVENMETSSDEQAMERVAAICALEAIGGYLALPDLLLALDDLHPVAANHAARALIRLGNRSGIPLLLSHLEGRTFGTGELMESPAFAGETAARILREISGKSFGYSADAGHAAKARAVAQWRRFFADLELSGEKLPLEGNPYQQGMDPETDRRIAFHVDMLGQKQFLYHEQARRLLQRMGFPALSFLREGREAALENDNATTRAGIAQVLAAIDEANSRQLLAELLRDPAGAVRARAALSLGELGGPEALRLLEGALDDADGGVRRSALQGLARIARDPALREPALAKLRGFDPGSDALLGVERTVAVFEASQGVEHREETLAMLLDPSIVFRNVAADALRRVTGSDGGYQAFADEAARKQAAQRFRTVLEGAGNGVASPGR